MKNVGKPCSCSRRTGPRGKTPTRCMMQPLTKRCSQLQNRRPGPRSRSNTARAYIDRSAEEDRVETRPTIPPGRTYTSRQESPARGHDNLVSTRPSMTRTVTMEPSRRDISPIGAPKLTRMPSDSLTIRTTRTQLRAVDQTITEHDVFADDSTAYTNSSPEQSHGELSTSPATSQGSGPIYKKGPPPPPPSRATKPGIGKAPPPPPPLKKTIYT